ncbi:MAG TPA: hypothetical protein VM537_22835 [Anaerolineae bacterium]|nr:hypothetical protein [Anaerolineae bacterium]HUW94266.1 hypothetical protein [Anaerolineae bacterium]
MELGWLFVVFDALVVCALLASVVLGVALILLGIVRRSGQRLVAGFGLLGAIAAFSALLLAGPVRSLRLCVQAPYLPPPASFDDSELVGMWQAHYGRSADTLTLKSDGTFTEIYEDRYDREYVFESAGRNWRMERCPDGRVRVYLQGARFYEEGTRVAEKGGRYGDWTFYDQVAEEFVTMPDTLVLNLRVDSAGEPLLLHLWSTGDEGFALFGCERNIFRRGQATP